MHELAVTQNILSIATRHAQQAQASKVTDLYLVIGDLSSIVDDSVQFYWDFITEGTICAGSKLHFKRIPAKARCEKCDHIFEMKQLIPCPNCGSARFKITEGEEFFVESISVERNNDHVQ
ncbi:MAG: hydrogenase maturation nickel metallochaperone HypA [Anaerolineaceae bacterium]|nr:hydrogenase maturation nickel metallochaperone HypA [Anaerolineaceae bacterium]